MKKSNKFYPNIKFWNKEVLDFMTIIFKLISLKTTSNKAKKKLSNNYLNWEIPFKITIINKP